MSPKDPEPIFFPRRYLPPTRSSITALVYVPVPDERPSYLTYKAVRVKRAGKHYDRSKANVAGRQGPLLTLVEQRA